MFARDRIGHEAQEGEPIRHGQRVGIGEIELELADPVFVVKGIDIPAQRVHRIDQLGQPRQVVEQPRGVIGGLFQVLEIRERREPALFGLAEHKELRLHAEVHRIAHLLGRRHLTAEDVARTGLELLPAAPQIGGEPRNVLLPGQDDAAVGIGVTGDLFVMDLLRNPVERGPGEHLGPGHHVGTMGDGHHLGFRHAMHVDV